jgi:hypothetical protein
MPFCRVEPLDTDTLLFAATEYGYGWGITAGREHSHISVPHPFSCRVESHLMDEKSVPFGFVCTCRVEIGHLIFTRAVFIPRTDSHVSLHEKDWGCAVLMSEGDLAYDPVRARLDPEAFSFSGKHVVSGSARLSLVR